jgi:hypothetical protein
MTLPRGQNVRSSPETELVLATAATCQDVGRRQRITALAGMDLAWKIVISRAARHGTLPLLTEYFGKEPIPAIPAAVATRLREVRRSHALRCLQLTGALLTATGLLRSQGIRILTFKGPTLALLVYGDVASRQFNDLDLLVHPTDFARARELIMQLGFHSRFEGEPEKDEHERFESGHLLLENNERVLIELHERLTGREFHFPVEFDELWSRRQKVIMGSEELDTFSLEDLILYLCAHGAKHSWCNLGWICDCGELLRRQPEINWQSVLERARATHCQRILLLGLSLAAEQSGVPVPEPLAALLVRDKTVRTLTDQVFRDLFCDKRPVFAHAVLGFRSRDRLRDSLRHALSILFVTRQADWEALDLSPTLWRMYPLLRPFRLALKYLHLVLRLSVRSLTRWFSRSGAKSSKGEARINSKGETGEDSD